MASTVAVLSDLDPNELYLLLPYHKLGRVLGGPMGGCENQELNHMVEVVWELLIPKSTVINASESPLQLLYDLVIPYALSLWIHQNVRKVVSPH